jgi:alpha,alpha-trehalase
MKCWLLFLFLTACAHNITPATGEMERLLRVADRDGDKKITVNDHPDVFELREKNGDAIKVRGVYQLSNLLQEMKLAEKEGRRDIDPTRLEENPVARISRNIRERYWDNLTRRVDPAHIAPLLNDPKLPKSEFRHLYIPHDDALALDTFELAAKQRPELKMKIWRLPEKIDQKFMRSIRDRQGLLALALGVPFVVPGGRFNEMYGWDSYFESLGLIQDGRVDLAKGMVDNFIYEIRHYGKILNANRTYYLNRSQPPFLTSMIQTVYDALPKGSARDHWFRHAVRFAIKEYDQVWMSAQRRTPIGLNRYYGEGDGIPIEVEKGHFDFILKPAAKRRGISLTKLTEDYNSGKIRDAALEEFFAHDLAVRESGHDTTYRWRVNGKDRAADFVTVDLNSLLYKYEIDLARWTGEPEWSARAEQRKKLMLKYLWDNQRKMFFDYNFKEQKRSTFEAASAFYPLWAGLIDEAQAKATIPVLLKALETNGGILATSKASHDKVADPKLARQWEYPNGWAPHQMIAWQALRNYGFESDRQRLIYKWVFTIAKNAADYNGTIPEKFDVVNRSHAVFAEYGNVGTDFSYITEEGFGWVNASFEVGLAGLSKDHRARLEKLDDPSKVFRDFAVK